MLAQALEADLPISRLMASRTTLFFGSEGPKADKDREAQRLLAELFAQGQATGDIDAAADPLQLAVYRVAWAEWHEVPLSRVDAAFLYVRSGEVVRPAGLPDRAGLERLLTGQEEEPAGNAGDGASARGVRGGRIGS